MIAASIERKFSRTVTLSLVGFGLALSLIADATLNTVLQTHTAEAGIALSQVGLILGANRAIRILLNSPYGVLIEGLSRRRVLIFSALLGASTPLFYAVPGFWPLLVGRLLWGAAWSGLWIGSNTMVLDLASPADRGQLVGRHQAWFALGIGLDSLVGGALTDAIGYAPTFRVTAAIIFGVALLWWLFLPETRDTVQQVRSRDDRAGTVSPHPTTTSGSRSGLATAIVLMGLVWLLFIGTFMALLPVLLQERLGDDVSLLGALVPVSTFTGAVIGGNQILGLVASPLAGWFSDRSGRRWGLVVLALVIGAFGTGLGAFGSGAWVILASGLNGLAISVMLTQLITLVGDYAREGRQGRLLGVQNTIGDLGGASGPLLAFWLLPRLELQGVLTLALGLLVLALPWALWVALQESRSGRAQLASER